MLALLCSSSIHYAGTVSAVAEQIDSLDNLRHATTSLLTYDIVQEATRYPEFTSLLTYVTELQLNFKYLIHG